MTTRGRVALKTVVWLVALAPLAHLLWGWWTDDLTVNPIEYVTRELGQTAFRLLLATLALTPLRLLLGVSWPITLRRLLGLLAFFYVTLHFAVWIVLDHFFDWHTMGQDIAKRPWITVGVSAFLLLAPLAATSTTGMIKRLGGARWRRLHRLIYVAGVLAALHYIWLAKKVLVQPWVYAAILAVLLGIRLWDAARAFARRRQALARDRIVIGSRG
ncbi:MAG TPA: protein-methionine-sulfoxide reductase heme-binding subunit MsrQ [Methylomirabilota bacterium]|nr:protein-methionine-sulfoxide reductase heme-binding subunit MsrQ [Methylomirabilota bacterium]